jgi:hypothetical protein
MSTINSAGVSAGVGTALGGLDAADRKFLSGAIKLGTAFSGEAAKYGVYAGYSLATEDWSDGNVLGQIGNALGDAYDEMGGLTINVASLGAILDMVGSVAARGNNGAQSVFGDGSILQSLSGIGLLEVNLGRDGVSAAIGMGGINVGGALYEQVKRGIDYAGLKSYAKEEQDKRKAEMAWNTYVHGDFTQENTAMRVASGKDYLVFTDKDFGLDDEGRVKLGETASGGRDGNGRTITVTDIGDLDTMSVVLGHESYRDGTLANNRRETIAAVIAHTKMAASMKADGSDFSNSAVGLDLAVYDYARSVGNMGIMAKYADSLYDSSGDFWLTKLDGTVEGTPGDPRMWREVIDANGKVIKELIPGSMEKGSQAASLVSLFGEDRILQRLGLTAENAMNIKNYDDQTLKDVFGWDDDQIKKARSDGITLTADDVQRRQLLGEAMLKQNGYTWDDSKNTWSGSSINIADVPVYDNVGIIKKGENYLPFSLNTMIYRDADAHKLYTYDSEADAWNLDKAYRDNTDVFVYRRDLITGETQRYEFAGPLNFVDNLDGKEYGANQAYEHPNLGTIQGATVAAGRMNMGISYSGNYGEVLLFSNFTDLKGDYFGANGMRAGLSSDPRTLYHATVNGLSDSCLVSYTDSNGSGEKYFNDNMNYLKNIFGLYRGYSVKTSLIDWNRNATPGGGVRAKEYKE